MKMLAGFPSFLRLDEAMAKLVVGSYLDVLERYDAGVIADACQRCIASASAWQPSAAEVRKACEDILAHRAAASRAATPRIAPPPRGIHAVPASERAAHKARIKEMLASWRAPEAAQ